MAKDYAKSFYNSTAWISTRRAYMSSKMFICEVCKGVADTCHHVEHISESNIDDPSITLDWDNLKSVCRDCHAYEHSNNQTTRPELEFDSDGNLVKRF